MPTTLVFRLFEGASHSELRGIGFLEGHSELSAHSVFKNFGGADERHFRSCFDQWLDRGHGPNNRFHNFKSDRTHRNCFVFKHVGHKHRLYGFLCNPNDDDPGFQLCALCIYAVKKENDTDKHELDRCEEWRGNMNAQEAIAKVFPKRRKKERTQWTN